MHIVKIPKWFQSLFNSIEWRVKTDKKVIYLTFDDGPNIDSTEFIISSLEKYHAKATFFCLGYNILKYPDQFKKINKSKFSIGNHTFQHMNGWKTKTKIYLNDVKKCHEIYSSNLFRPPFGKINPFQIDELKKTHRIIMWDINSWDFDPSINKELIFKKMVKKIQNGSIVLFHDNKKSLENLRYLLPKVLSYFSEKGYKFEKL